jgi:hypothetical protein
MSRITFSEISRVFIITMLINIVFALFLLTWANDDDIIGLPKQTINRYISLFYFSITTFTTTGFGDISAKSDRMKIVLSIFMISMFAGIVSFIFEF